LDGPAAPQPVHFGGSSNATLALLLLLGLKVKVLRVNRAKVN